MLSPDYAKARNLLTDRGNTILLCRFTVKTVIDKASVRCIEEDDEDVINLIAAIEQVLSHGLRKVRSWLSDGHCCYYDFVSAACRAVPSNCFSTVEAMEFLKDGGLSKGRAWLKLALMEKHLSQYLSAAFQQHSLARSFYHDHAIFLSEDMNVLMQDLLGLSALDFNFFLKDDADAAYSKELMIVDLAPYLRFHQCAESVLSDIQEARRSASSAVDPARSDCGMAAAATVAIVPDWEQRFEALQKQHAQLCEQKVCLEEAYRQKGRQLDDCQLRIKQLCRRMTQDAAAWASERRRLELLVARMRLDTQVCEKLQDQRVSMTYVQGAAESQEEIQKVLVLVAVFPVMVHVMFLSLAATELALDNSSELSISVSDVTAFNHGVSIKDDNRSLISQIGSLCSQAYAARDKTDADDGQPRSLTSVHKPWASPTNKEVSGDGNEALHSLSGLQNEAYSLAVQPAKTIDESNIGDASLDLLATSRCFGDDAPSSRTDVQHSMHADVVCRPTSDEYRTTSAAVLSLLDSGPPPMAHSFAFVSTDASEEASALRDIAPVADILPSFTVSQSLSMV